MGILYEAVTRIDRVIERRKLPLYLTRGKIAIRAGFAIGMITPETPDDAQKLASLRAAAREVLGEPV